MSRWSTRFFTVPLSAAMLCALTLPAAAQETMTEIQPLDFGLFSLRDNAAQHTVAVAASDNSYVADPAFVVATPPQRAEYFLEGFTPGTQIFVNVDDGGLTLGGGGGTAVFSSITYTVSPGTIIADGAGEATVFVGATLRTIGDSNVYPSGAYSDSIDITFSW